uniref:Uncharacterized protein n=1 Tax=viral metagenome TaxID=1070528 RepID=A0A6C0BRC4_9ZZZZ
MPTTVILLFVTIVYFIFGEELTPFKRPNVPTNIPPEIITYIPVLVFVQYVMNQLTLNSCNSKDKIFTIMITTFLTLTVLFGMYGLLIQFPGWLTPFANTFGYSIGILYGLENVIRSVFKKESDVDDTGDLKEILVNMTTDPTLIYNEIDVENFSDFIAKMNPIIISGDESNKLSPIYKLKELVIIKYKASVYLWFLLVGLVSFSITNNYILSQDCKPDKKE